jgi:hypothetical protein
MKTVTIAALVAAQTVAAAPARAAELLAVESPHARATGAFAGARLRLSLDSRASEPVRAGFTIAPMTRATRASGESRTRIGEGVELGFTGRGTALSIGGLPIAGSPARRPGERSSLSPIAYVAIGVGVAAIGYAVWFFHEMGDCDDHDDEC